MKSFKEDAEKAVTSKNQHEGCVRWQKHFGDRFSCSTAKDVDEDALQQEFSGTIKRTVNMLDVNAALDNSFYKLSMEYDIER